MRLKKDKSGDTVGRPSWRSSLSGDPGAKFFCGKPQHMKNSLNFANTCLKVIDTRRSGNRGCDVACDASYVRIPAGSGRRGYSDSPAVARTFDGHRNHALYAHKSRLQAECHRETRRI